MNRKTSLRFTGYIIWFFSLTLLFAVVNFPRENLTSWVNVRLASATDGVLQTAQASTLLPLSLKMRGLSLETEAGPVTVGDAVVTPNIFSFLTGGKGISVRLTGPWGSSRARLRAGKENWGVQVGSFEADLGNFPLPQSVPYSLQGTARATLDLTGGNGSSEKKMEGQGEISGQEMELAGGILETLGLSPLGFSKLKLFFTVEDGVLNIGENMLEGDINAKARGTVRLAEGQFENSRLDLTVEVQPTDRVRQTLVPLLSMVGVQPRTDGIVTFRIRGTIGRPSIKG
jgi:type II secretion system protein N